MASAPPPLPGFTSLLSPEQTDRLPGTDTAGEDFISDLNLDQIIEAISADRDERELITRVLYRQVRDIDTLQYRHEVFRDLEAPGLLAVISRFGEQMRQVRSHLRQLPGMRSSEQRQGWFLDATTIYCTAVRTLACELADRSIQSRGLQSFRDCLARYATSPAFERLDADTAERKKDLARVMYLVRIRGPRVEVSRYDGEPDYSAEVEDAFARFQQGEVSDYRLQYRTWPAMTHVGEQILTLVARLFREEFAALAEFCRQHAGFADAVIDQFDRELQFYLAYLNYVAPLRAGRPAVLPPRSHRRARRKSSPPRPSTWRSVPSSPRPGRPSLRTTFSSLVPSAS